jgi:S1-C subfamily serine protease
MVEEVVEKLATGKESESEINDIVNKMTDGFTINFIVSEEDRGTYREPTTVHDATVLKHDQTHDLALLKVNKIKDVPNHHVAPIAASAPLIGEKLSIYGHVVGMTWTYTQGLVSAYREENFRPVESDGKRGPYMQVAGEVFKGNSGGGAFNDRGELVGIASFMVPAPNECFFVHVSVLVFVVVLLCSFFIYISTLLKFLYKLVEFNCRLGVNCASDLQIIILLE